MSYPPSALNQEEKGDKRMRRRIISILMLIVMIFTLTSMVATASATSVTAKPTTSKVLVNGNETSFDAYNINDNNYFKIRDIAFVLSGTGKQFNVIWDKELQAVSMTSHQAYTVVGGEMSKGDGTNKSATLNTAKVYMDGKEVSLTAYNIGGNNYVKLRDLGQLFDFGVRWDGSVVIDTSTGYEVETSPTTSGEKEAAGGLQGQTEAEIDQWLKEEGIYDDYHQPTEESLRDKGITSDENGWHLS